MESSKQLRASELIKIAPSILAADFARLGEQVTQAQDAGADLIHIDIMDGRFVPNITMGPAIVEAVAKLAAIPLDVHLMIVEPDRFVQRFADSGADSLTVHVEACTHLHRVLGQISDAGCLPGVALNPHTPASALREVIEMISIVNVMTVNPGFGGQRYISGMSGKISELRALVEGREVEIEVDGGINAETISVAEAAGATIAIAGTCVFQHQKGIAAGIEELRQAAAAARTNARP